MRLLLQRPSRIGRFLILGCFAAWALGISSQAFCDLGFFGSQIDYWHDSKEQTPIVSPSPRASPTVSNSKEGGKFDWKPYLDPNSKEFFKEGDYTPPEPFMETIRNPTDENLKMWFSYIEKKNELSNRLEERMKEYLEKTGQSATPEAQQYVTERIAALPKVSRDARRFRFRMYFDSQCPHCRKMFGTLAELQAQGFEVEARQVDRGPLNGENQGVPVEYASPAELHEKEIQSVPVLLVGDLSKKTVYRMTGYRSAPEVFQALAQGGAGQ